MNTTIQNLDDRTEGNESPRIGWPNSDCDDEFTKTPSLLFYREKPLHIKRILVLGTASVIGKGVESLLSSETELEVVGVGSEDEAEFLTAIERHQPHIVI